MTIPPRPRRRLREKYFQLRHWLGAVRLVLPRNGSSPVRPAELGAWLDEAHTSTQADLRGKRILIFTYLPWWLDCMAAVSAVLVGRGADVTYAWLPYARYEQETPDLDDRSVALYTPVLTKPRARFRSINLADSPTELAPVTEALKRMAVLDTQLVERCEEIDIAGADRKVYEFRLHRLRHAHGALSRVLRDGKYDNVLMPSGGVVEFAAAWQAAAEAGANTVTLETWERKQTCAVAYGRPVYVDTAKEIWDADSKKLDEARRARVEESMRVRESPKWAGYVVSYQSASVKGADELRAQLGLDDRRPVALICPNVPYDAAYILLKTGFASMADWFRVVLRELGPRSDWQVVIRAHPAEMMLTPRQSAELIVKEVYPTLPEHFHFVAPTDKVNTYALMRLAKIGLVFGSTTGLEMAARGLKVVMPEATHYAGQGFTHDAFTRDGYIAGVRDQLNRPQPLTQDQIDLAWCYFDVYMNQWCRPFPWCLETFAADIREWPLRRVLDARGMERFGDTFTILGGGERARALVLTPNESAQGRPGRRAVWSGLRNRPPPARRRRTRQSAF